MDFHSDKESSTSYISPCFFAWCLRKEFAYRLSTPPHPSQPRPPLRSLHNVLEKSFLSLIKRFEFFIWLWILVKKLLSLMYLLVSLPVACSNSSVINSSPPTPLHSDTIRRHHIYDFGYPYKQFLFCFFMLFVDLNECTMNTHNCNANNYCNNTLGSFTCTCKLGFSGNGTSCTGRQWYIMLSTLILLSFCHSE